MNSDMLRLVAATQARSLDLEFEQSAGNWFYTSTMKNKGVLLVLLFALISFGAGILVGKKTSAAGKSAAETTEVSSDTKNSTKLPPIKIRSTRVTPSADSDANKKITAADAQARLDEILKKPMQKRWEALNDFVKAIEPAEIPLVMQMVEKISSQQTRSQLRMQ